MPAVNPKGQPFFGVKSVVSILVLMDARRKLNPALHSERQKMVSILVLMDARRKYFVKLLFEEDCDLFQSLFSWMPAVNFYHLAPPLV